MKSDIYLGVAYGLMALVSIGGLFSPRFRGQVFRSLSVSRMTCGLLFLLSGEAFISELRLIGADKIYRSIQIATVILFVVSIAADFYLAKNRSKKHWLVFGAAIILGCLITMAYLSARARGRARDTGLPAKRAAAPPTDVNALIKSLGLALALAFAAFATTAASLPPNLARYAKATATSEFSGQYSAQFAVDGKIPEAGSQDDLSQAWCVRGDTHRQGADLTLEWTNTVMIAEIVYYGRTACTAPSRRVWIGRV